MSFVRSLLAMETKWETNFICDASFTAGLGGGGDLEEMMRQMGGLGGGKIFYIVWFILGNDFIYNTYFLSLGPAGGKPNFDDLDVNEEDSDDEDLPDLE